MMDIFSTVKQSVTMEAVAERYGLTVNRGKALCPFHNDTHPSLFIRKDFFYCFVCNAGGDQISFVSKMFDLSPMNAAKRICSDFGIPYQGSKGTAYQIASRSKELEHMKQFSLWEEAYIPVILRVYRNISKVLNDHIGIEGTEDLMTALQIYSRIGYFANILTFGSKQEKEELYKNCRKEIDQLVSTAYTIT